MTWADGPAGCRVAEELRGAVLGNLGNAAFLGPVFPNGWRRGLSTPDPDTEFSLFIRSGDIF